MKILKPVRIGMAKDAAFCFYYADNIRFLEQNGAEIIYFSPLKEAHLPKSLDGLYFCGGYPELYAEKLSENKSLLSEIKAASDKHMPIYGECGGFIYLSKTLLLIDNRRFDMAGCFPFEISMQEKLAALGYRRVRLTKDNLLGKNEDVIRGHEFHYSKISRMGLFESTSYDIEDRKGIQKTREGYLTNATLGSYLHLHFASRPETAAHFVASCRNYQQKAESI